MCIHEFGSLVINQADALKPFATSLTRDNEIARDLFQETICRAFVHRQKYQSGTNVKAWLCTIMRNIFINEYRRNEKRKLVVDAVAYDQRNNSYKSSSDNSIRLREINNAIYNLPETFKNACLLYLHGYKYKEIATDLNELLGTIKSRIHFARKCCKNK